MMHFNTGAEERHTTSCISVAIQIYDMTFNDAVKEILGSEAEILTEQDFQVKQYDKFEYDKEVKHSKTFADVFHYLGSEREIDTEIINLFKRNGLLMQDQHKNCVFRMINRETMDINDVIGIELKGTQYIPPEKRMNPKRDHFLFQHPANDKTAVFFAALSSKMPTEEIKIFEAPIEVMSFLSLNKKEFLLTPRDHNIDFVAGSGLKHAIEAHFRKVVRANEKLSGGDARVIPKLTLCVNNDKGGIEYITSFKKFLSREGYSDKFLDAINIELPKSVDKTIENFDYNDLLKETNRLNEQREATVQKVVEA
ncbi:DUF3991 domain-containing protein [Enterococcus termitis]